MIKKLQKLINDPYPLKTVTRKIIRELKLGMGAVARPHYGYCVYHAALLAKKLGYDRISVVEFGVASGNGLVNLEYHAQQVSTLLAIEIDIYGFDTGEGLPAPVDYRDLPYHWKKGFYKMDVPKLQARLKKAKLVLGDIKDTAKNFFTEYDPAPIGAIAYDFDLYSSTAVALNMLDADEKYYLPRVFCYFDDIIGTDIELYNEYTGERLAINEFNHTHPDAKFGLPHHLLARNVVESWYHSIRICHFFKHSCYDKFISSDDQHIALAR